MLNLTKKSNNKSLNYGLPIKQNNFIKQTKKETFDVLTEGDLSNKNFSSKYYVPETKQWVNSIYMYNKINFKLLPLASNLVDSFLKSYFNIINRESLTEMDKVVTQKKKSLYRRNKSSINKVWLSKSETKHTNDKVIITIYVYNKKRNIFIYKLRNLYKELLFYGRNLKNKSVSLVGNYKKRLNTISSLPKPIATKRNLFGKNYKTNNISNEKKHMFYKNIISGLKKNNRKKNEKTLSYKNLMGKGVYKYFIKNTKNLTSTGLVSNIAKNKYNGKLNYFKAKSFVYKPSVRYWYSIPNLSNNTITSTKNRLSNFIKVMEKKNIVNLKNTYTTFVNKYHLNNKKTPLSINSVSKYNCLNSMKLLKYNTNNLQIVSVRDWNTLYCSKLLFKLYLLSKSYGSEKNNLKLNSSGFNSKYNNINSRKQRNRYNLIKLYKQIYVINEYKKNNNIITNLLINSIVETKSLFSNYNIKLGEFKLGIKKSNIFSQKKIKKSIASNVHSIYKLLDVFNNKKNAITLAPNLKDAMFTNYVLNNYLVKTYKKEINLLRLVKNINIYSYTSKSFLLNGLKNIISKIYKKKVELNIVNLKHVYLNSDIFTQSISSKLRNRRNRLLSLLKKSLKTVKMPNKNSSFYYKEIKSLYNRNFINKYKTFESYTAYISSKPNFITKKTQKSNNSYTFTQKTKDSLNQWISNTFYNTRKNLRNLYINNKSFDDNKYINNPYVLNGVEKTVINCIRYKSVFGVRLEAAGRLTRRFTASRSLFKIKYIGNLRNTNSLNHSSYSPLVTGINKPNIQFTKIASKTRNGSFGLKGWVSGH